MGPGDLAEVLKSLRAFWMDYEDDRLLVGLKGAPDDAAVYRLSEEQAIIQTVDFFTPIVDDPRAYGAIAAANSMSDVYAMGGEVMLALNVGGFPDSLPREMIAEIFLGAAEKVREAGAVVAGGHTIVDEEPKFGLVVTGTIHPDRVLTLVGAQPGDQLLLTKPLGSGIIATAARNDALHETEHLEEAVAVMLQLNQGAAVAMQRVGVHACTDITGFGLLGHASEMATASGIAMVIGAAKLPLMRGALRYAREGHLAGGLKRNRAFFTGVKVDSAVDQACAAVAWDPQTSGGLLIAVSKEKTDEMLATLEGEGVSGYHIGQVYEGKGIKLVTE